MSYSSRYGHCNPELTNIPITHASIGSARSINAKSPIREPAQPLAKRWCVFVEQILPTPRWIYTSTGRNGFNSLTVLLVCPVQRQFCSKSWHAHYSSLRGWLGCNDHNTAPALSPRTETPRLRRRPRGTTVGEPCLSRYPAKCLGQ